jgi:integrase
VTQHAGHRKASRSTAPKKRPLQNSFVIGDAAIDEGMPPERRGARAILEPDDGGVANDFFWEIQTGKYGERCADAGLKWLSPNGSLPPSEGSQKTYVDAASSGLRWLVAHKLDFTTVRQDDVALMGKEMVRKGRSSSRVALIQHLVLAAAQFCVWTGRRADLRIHSVAYKVQRGDFTFEGQRPAVLVKFKPKRVRYIDETTQSRIVVLIRDIAKRIGIKFAFLGCRGAEAAGVENANVPLAGTEAAAVFGKGRKWRDVHLTTDLASEIAFYRQAVRPIRLAKFKRNNPTKPAPTALLLNGKNGNPLNYTVLRRALQDAAAVLGLDTVKLHWARHAFAANWMAANAILMIRRAAAAGMQLNDRALKTILDDLRPELSELMGHTDFSVTKKYLTRVRQAILAHLAAFAEQPASPRAA